MPAIQTNKIFSKRLQSQPSKKCMAQTKKDGLELGGDCGGIVLHVAYVSNSDRSKTITKWTMNV
jgi:hypothetical protein